MSGLLEDIATPCPSRMRSSGSTFDLWTDDSFDDTQNLEFTTEIKAPVLTGAKPRRRNKTTSGFQIHDENEDMPARPIQRRKRETGIAIAPTARKSSLLAQPAQRFRPKMSFVPSPVSKTRPQVEEAKIQNTRLDMQENKALLMQINGKREQVEEKDVLKKDVRRDTVYIPTEDTTVATAVMGPFSSLKSRKTIDIDNEVVEDTRVNSVEAQVVRKREAKRSLTSSARRAPLQPSSKVAQESTIRTDVAGKNGGKENIPPGGLPVGAKGKDKNEFPIFEQPVKARPAVRSASRTSTLAKSTAKPLSTKPTNSPSQKRPALGVRNNNAKPPAVNMAPKADTIMKKTVKSSNTAATSRKPAVSKPLKHSISDMAKAAPAPKAKKLNSEYPLLAENISNPTLYDDDWLTHQEVVIGQLVNGLFDHTNDSKGSEDPVTLRHGLLNLYQDESFTHFHKRLQASLLYGSLSIPKDVLARSARLKQDVGLRRKFLDIWTQTYDLHALRAAIETVIGRKIANDSVSQDGNCGMDEKTLKRKLEGLLNIFLFKNEDMKQPADRKVDAAGKAYRRTLMRSIMIVVLLDKAQQLPKTQYHRCLFVPSSKLKSSAGVLQALGRLLLPGSGDIVKALHHIDCQLSYEQHGLQEYDYQITNLAVDLRDGVRLTRLVELLIYPSASNVQGAEQHSAGERGSWPLSQRLKFPCLSRPVQLHNVQIGLDSLASAGAPVHGIRAEDIVNGHREKTITLLWNLVSKWGLAGLIGWDELRKEIERLKQKAVSELGHEVKDKDWYRGGAVKACDEHTFLLHHWASMLAGLKALRVENLSFADGKVYESILDEYQGSHQTASLKQRLQTLGCSLQFANLVCSSTQSHSPSPILGSDFTFGALAFLCSRLLPESKKARAATVLQVAWRRILARRELHRRSLARSVAMQCAAVVQTRDRLFWAKSVIMVWWRTVRERRAKSEGISV